MEEKLRLARLSQRLHFQDEGRGRLSHLYKKILTALHRQRKVSVITADTKCAARIDRKSYSTSPVYVEAVGVDVHSLDLARNNFGVSSCPGARADVFQRNARKMTGRMRHD